MCYAMRCGAMVLQAIFGDDSAAEASPSGAPALRLVVRGQSSRNHERRVAMRVTLCDGYPSHVPPCVELLEGVPAPDVPFVADSLAELFYDTSVGASVVHAWSEWLRDEWIAKRP